MPKIGAIGGGSPGLSIGAAKISGAGNTNPLESPASSVKLGTAMEDIAGAFSTANARADLMTAKADAYAKLLSVRDGLHDETDPEALKTKWEEQSGQIQQEFTTRLKGNDKALTEWNAWFTEHKAKADFDVNSLYRSKTVDKGKASGMLNEDVLLNTLNKGSRPKDYDWALQLHDDDVADKLNTGVYTAQEAEKRRLLFKADVDKLRDKNMEEQRIGQTYAALYSQFGKNPNAAVKYLEDPNNRAALGIGHKDALNFIHEFDGQAARDKRRADEARTTAERSEKEAYYRALEKNDLDGANTILARSRNIPGSERQQMRAALAKDQWNDDPKVAANTQRAVWAGQLTDPNQLTPLIGNGLSLKTARTLREDLEKINKEAPDFPGAMNYFDNALKRYDMVFDKDSPMHEQRGKFAATLAHQAKQQKIGPFDPRMDGLADGLLKTVDKTWYKPFSKETKFEQMFDEKALPLPGMDEAPLPKRAASAPQGLGQRVPPQDYAEIKAELAKAGRRNTDEDIYAVWFKSQGSK